VTVQNRIFFTYLYLDNTTGMTHLKIKTAGILPRYFSLEHDNVPPCPFQFYPTPYSLNHCQSPSVNHRKMNKRQQLKMPLSLPWRHIEGVKVKLHSFLTVSVGGGGELQTWAALPLQRTLAPIFNRRLGGPQNRCGRFVE